MLLSSRLTSTFAGVLVLTVASFADGQQSGVQLPSSAEPRPDIARPVVPTPTAPGEAIAIPKTPATEAPKGAETFKLTLRRVTIEGSTVYTPDEFRALYGDMIGHDVSVADLFRVANEIELRYRNDGYVTSRVIVPAQTIEGGAFRIQVVEGFISDIVYPDNVGASMTAIKRLIEPLRNVTPINIEEIERRLLLADDLPGMTVRATLEAAKNELGGSVVVLKAERKPVDASVAFSNRNSPYLGTGQTTAVATLNSVGPNADTVSVFSRVSSPFRRSWTTGASYQALLSGNGLTFSANASYARSRPGLSLDPLDVKSGVVSGTATLTYPLIRSRLTNLRAVGEFEYRNVAVDLASDTFNRDRLRILRSGVSFDKTDSWDGITAVRALVHQGLDVFGATSLGSPYASRTRGHSEFTKLTVDLTRVQQLPANFSLMATATAQFANTRLLASEQMALGGPNYGRAFDEGELSNDNGWAASLEARYTPQIPENRVVQGVQVYTFIDAGEVWAHGSVASDKRAALVSIGGGLRAKIAERFYGTVEVAKPINRVVNTEGDKGARVFFSISLQY